MMLFRNIDREFEKNGFTKIEEDKYGVEYERYNEKYKYTQVIYIGHKASRNHIIQSYDKNLMDEKKIGNTCVGITYPEIKLVLKKFQQMKRKYKWV